MTLPRFARASRLTPSIALAVRHSINAPLSTARRPEVKQVVAELTLDNRAVKDVL
jgi:hypothetical protein